MTTNNPVQRFTDMGAETVCPVNNMREYDYGDYVLYADYKALQDDRDQQYVMKVMAREQRDAVTTKLNALQAECVALRAKTSMSLGVGDGTGNLFVHGDYASINRLEKLIFEYEKMRSVLTQAREYVFEPDRDCKCKDCVDATSLLNIIDTALQKG